MTYRVRIQPEAEKQVRELHAWWKANRPASRINVKHELRRMRRELSRFPKRYSKYKDRDVHQCRIKGTPYYVLYRVDDEAHEVSIVTAWSSMRHQEPPLAQFLRVDG